MGSSPIPEVGQKPHQNFDEISMDPQSFRASRNLWSSLRQSAGIFWIFFLDFGKETLWVGGGDAIPKLFGVF